MAPLKVPLGADVVGVVSMFPWLKGHGPIEGGDLNGRLAINGLRFPWLKGHGPIEGIADIRA